MSDILLIILLFSVGAGGALVVFFLSKIRQKRSFEAFTKATSLNLDHFKNPNDFSFSGDYHGYPMTISNWIPPMAPDAKHAEKSKWLRIDVPLSNPNKKFLSIEKGLGKESWYELFEEPDVVTVQHDLGAAITILASDLWFHSFVLNEENVIRTGVMLKHTDKGLVAIQGDAMFAVLPNTLANTQTWKPVAEAMTLLNGMKQALNEA